MPKTSMGSRFLGFAALVGAVCCAGLSVGGVFHGRLQGHADHPAMMYRIHGLLHSQTIFSFRSYEWINTGEDSTAASSGVTPLALIWGRCLGSAPVHVAYPYFLVAIFCIALPLVLLVAARLSQLPWWQACLLATLSLAISPQQVRSLLHDGTIGMNLAIVAASIAGLAVRNLIDSGRCRSTWLATAIAALGICGHWPLAVPFVGTVSLVGGILLYARWRESLRSVLLVLLPAAILLPLWMSLTHAPDSSFEFLYSPPTATAIRSSQRIESFGLAARWLSIQPTFMVVGLLWLIDRRTVKDADSAVLLIAIVAAGVILTIAAVFPETQEDRALLLLGPLLLGTFTSCICSGFCSIRGRSLCLAAAFVWVVVPYVVIGRILKSRAQSPIEAVAKVIKQNDFNAEYIVITDAALLEVPDQSWAYFPILSGKRCLASRVYRDATAKPLSSETSGLGAGAVIFSATEWPRSGRQESTSFHIRSDPFVIAPVR